MSACGHTWKAPRLLPPGQREVRVGGMTIPVKGGVVYVEQKCAERAGHDGPHRSLWNVTRAA